MMKRSKLSDTALYVSLLAFILFARGQYGCFHIRHRDGDIACRRLGSDEDSVSEFSKVFE